MLSFSNVLNIYVESLKKNLLEDSTIQFYHDFKIRWNTTYLMLERTLLLKTVVNKVTSNSDNIPRLTVILYLNYYIYI
jgi:hypothetical protein